MSEPRVGCDWGGCWPGHGAVCAGHPEAVEEEGGQPGFVFKSGPSKVVRDVASRGLHIIRFI